MNHSVGVDVVMSCLFVLCFYHPSVINTGLLQRFLAQTGGHSGGWDDYDQQLFLKLKSKHKVQNEKFILDYHCFYKTRKYFPHNGDLLVFLKVQLLLVWMQELYFLFLVFFSLFGISL